MDLLETHVNDVRSALLLAFARVGVLARTRSQLVGVLDELHHLADDVRPLTRRSLVQRDLHDALLVALHALENQEVQLACSSQMHRPAQLGGQAQVRPQQRGQCSGRTLAH